MDKMRKLENKCITFTLIVSKQLSKTTVRTETFCEELHPGKSEVPIEKAQYRYAADRKIVLYKIALSNGDNLDYNKEVFNTYRSYIFNVNVCTVFNFTSYR